jgi:hypothetical protein
VLNEYYRIIFRKKIYSDIGTLPIDLDEYTVEYNAERTYQEKRCKGRTPMETFIEGKKLFNEKNIRETMTAA